MSELRAVVAAYWTQYRLAAGDRPSRLRVEAGEFAWAWDRVEDSARTGSLDVLELLDALLDWPDADPCYLGAGPIEELLVHHGARFDAVLAERCRQSQLWRAALACVWLDDAEEKRLDALRPYLPPLASPAGEPSSTGGPQGRRKKRSRDNSAPSRRRR